MFYNPRVCPRKPLFLVCGTMMALSQCAMGTYAYFNDDHPDATNYYGWVPIVCVLLLNSFQIIGVMSVVQLLLAESFPTEIRSYASGIVGASTAINMFGATKLYPSFLANLGLHGTFWMYGAVMFIEVIYGALSIPENKGESLVKTEDKMVGKVGAINPTYRLEEQEVQ